MRLYELDELIALRETPCAEVLDVPRRLQFTPRGEEEIMYDQQIADRSAEGSLAILLYPDAVFQSTFMAPDDDKPFGIGNICLKMHDAEAWFWMYTALRQAIWFARFVKRWPQDKWPGDFVTQKKRLPNVYRELDRSTLFVSWAVLDRQIPFVDALWRIVATRVIHDVEVADRLFPLLCAMPTHTVESSASLRDALTDAPSRLQEIDFVLLCDMCKSVAPALQTNSMMTQEALYKTLVTFPHVGAYTAYQIMLDLCTHVVWRNAPLLQTRGNAHIVVSKRAANMLYAMGVHHGKGETLRAIEALQASQDSAFRRLGIDFMYPSNPALGTGWKLSIHNIEHALRSFALWNAYGEELRNDPKNTEKFIVQNNVWRPDHPVPPYWLER